MPKIEGIDNIEPFPNLRPLVSKSETDQHGKDHVVDMRVKMPASEVAENSQVAGADGVAQSTKKRVKFHTPTEGRKIEYRHQGEKVLPKDPIAKPKPKSGSHAKRSDHLTLFFIVCAVILVSGTVVFVLMSDKSYVLKKDMPAAVTSANVGFYQGNHVFSKTLEQEKEAKKTEEQHEIHGISAVNNDLEISLRDQMTSMEEKIQTVRQLKAAGEDIPSSPDLGSKPDMLNPLKPTKDENFQSPLEFNKNLPKTLRTNP